MKREANILVSILWVIIFILNIAIFFIDTSNMRENITMLALGLSSVCIAYDSIKSIILGKDLSKNTLIFRTIIGIISIGLQTIILIKYAGFI